MAADRARTLPRETEPVTAFDDFYRREYRPLLRIAWSLTGRKDLGEELVQETMVTVHQRWETVGGYERPGAYARRVVLNAATSAARRRAAEKRAVKKLRAQRQLVRLAPEAPPDDEFWSALRALPERQCQTVALHYLEDISIEDIAAVLDIAPNTVKVHLHRGRLALAESLSHIDEGTER